MISFTTQFFLTSCYFFNLFVVEKCVTKLATYQLLSLQLIGMNYVHSVGSTKVFVLMFNIFFFPVLFCLMSYLKYYFQGVPAVAQWVKNLALSLVRGFDPQPGPVH